MTNSLFPQRSKSPTASPSEGELGQCPRAAEALAQRKVMVPPALPKAAGGFSRFGRRVLPVAGTAAAIGLTGCAVGNHPAQGPSSAPQRVTQQVEDFTKGIPAPGRGKLIKGADGSITWDGGEDRQPASPRAVAIESRRGMPQDLVPDGVLVRQGKAAAAEVPALSEQEMANVAEMARPAKTSGVLEMLQGRRVAVNAADARTVGRVVLPEFTQARTEAPVLQAAVVPAEPTFDEALAVLRKHAAERGLNGALALALLDGGTGKGDALATLAPVDQQVVGDLLGALDRMAVEAPGETLSDRAGPLLDAAKRWQADADLTLPKLALASRVDSFGVYTPAEATFEGGRRHSVIIYCEVANFQSDKKEGWYTTKLAQQESLIAADGLVVWRPSAEEVEDKSMNQRRDFYLVKKMTIPDNLGAGKYTLRMTVTDRTSGKLAMVTMPLEISSK